jgi:hypothetical protein
MPVLQNNLVFSSIEELFAGRKGKPFSAANLFVREYTRRFRVMARENAVTALEVCFCQDAPLPFSPFATTLVGANLPVDLKSLCVELSAEMEHPDDWQSWILTAEYSTRVPKGGPDLRFQVGDPSRPEYIGNQPWLMRPEIEWDFVEKSNNAKVVDLNGKPYLNSARQPFQPPYSGENAYPVLVLTRNERDVSQDLINSYAYAVNSDVFLGAPPETAQILPFRAVEEYQGDTSFFRITYRVRFQNERNKDGTIKTWQPRVLDCGLCELMPFNVLGIPFRGEPVPIFGPGGVAVAHPRLLDGKGGKKLPDPQTGVIDPVYIDFVDYPKKPFAALLTGGLGGP